MPNRPTTKPPRPLTDADLSWHQVRLALVPHHPERRATHPLVVLRGLIKSVGAQCAAPPLAFHVPECPVRDLPQQCVGGGRIPLEVILFTADPDQAAAWVQALRSYLRHEPRANHHLATEPILEHRRFHPPAPEVDATAVELEFLTPLPFRPAPGGPPTALTLETFFAGLQTRVQGLFGQSLASPVLDGVRLQSEYWGYHKIDAPSYSQPGHQEWLHGGIGPLWFRGSIAPILPWLELAAQVHAGGKRELNPLGYCRLHRQPRPHFDPMLGRPGLYRRALERLTRQPGEADAALTAYSADACSGAAPANPCQALAAAIADGTWQPAPAQAFPIPKHEGVRWVERLEPETRLVHAVLHGLLQGPFDRLFSSASFGYRPGKSVDAAMALVQQCLAEGYRYVVRTDIHDCFGALDHDRLATRLDQALPPADIRLRALLRDCLSAPVARKGLIEPRLRGVAQGSPLSPLLANLYLDPLDRALAAGPGRLVRFADDMALLARTREAAEDLLGRVARAATDLGLALNPGKTAITEADEGFTFLGQSLDTEGPDAPAGPPRLPLRKTLYITEVGDYLGNNGEAVEIRRHGAPLEVIPLRRLGRIVLLAPAVLSTGLLARCTSAGVPIVVAPGGRVSALVAPASRGFFETSAQQARHWQALGEHGRLAIARRLAESKLSAYRYLLRQRYAPGLNQVLAFIDEQLASLATAADTAAVRGYEGVAARRIQRAIDGFIRVPEFHFARRDRFEPDRMNPLFNMGYHLLFGRLSALLRGAGLNPWLGYLHDAGDVYESLVCDLQEPFRAPVDRMLLALVNRHEVRPEHFTEGPHGLRLSAEAIRTIAGGFEAMLHDTRRQPTLAQAIDAQVESLRRHVLGRESLWIYRWGEDRHTVGEPGSDEEPSA